MMNGFKKVLVISPHTDDETLGAGGTITRFVDEGKEVWCVAFSFAGLPVLKKETKKAIGCLGLPPKNSIILDYKTRHFSERRQEILDEMIKLEKKINPDLVLLPSTYDTHQDHQVISQEGFRAFKKSSILGYELPWNNLTFGTDCFIKLDEWQLCRKETALAYYLSQESKPYMAKDFIRSLARVRGIQMGADFAEAFQKIRWIL